MNKNWKEKESWNLKNLSWKAKKHVAETACAFVVVCSMVLSLYAPSVHQMDETAQNRSAGNYQIENNGASVSLKLNSTQVKREISENAAGSEGTGFQDRDSQIDGNQNRVAQNTVHQMGKRNQNNLVVKNPAPLSLVSTIFKNCGQIPEMGDVVTGYQYPVEISYAIDKNYDGKQTKKDTILNIVMDTMSEKEEDSGSDTNPVEDTTEADSSEMTEDNSEEGGADSEEEQDLNEKEKFQNEIWSELLVTEPVQVEMEGKLQVEDSKERVAENQGQVIGETTTEKTAANEAVSEENAVKESSTETKETTAEESAAETKETTTEESAAGAQETTAETVTKLEDKDNLHEHSDKMVTADAGYYIIKGMMCDGREAFVSDIQIIPSGVDGFNKVRLGKDGEFMDSILITEDAADKELELYFTDGERITAQTIFTYTKDTHSPEIKADEGGVKVISSESDKIYCANNPKVAVTVEDGNPEQSAGIEKISSVYGDKIVCVFDISEKPTIALPQDFFGRVLLNCEDKAGNTSDIISQYYLVEQNAPEITFTDSEICTAPYILWVDVADTGHIISGIDDIECTVNGEHYDITDLRAQENVRLTDTLEVSSRAGFSIPFGKEGSYQIRIQVTDNAGNITIEEKTIEVTQPQLVAVYMPQEFTIHIDPLRILEKEQIFSDNITLNNVGNVNVRVKVEDIVVTVKDEISDTGVVKDCNLYLVAPDTGKKIKLNKGSNKDIYSYCLPKNAEGEIANLYFVGDTTEGSDSMWRSSDITIDMKLSFDKWKE